METITSIAPWAVAHQIINIILIVGIPAALLCLLQWWLSKRQSPVPGLILPVLHVILSIILLMSVAAYSVHDFISVTAVTTGDDGIVMVEDSAGNVLALSSFPDEVPAESDAEPQEDGSSVGIIGGADEPTAIYAHTESTIPKVIGLFLLFNIPTYIYVIIYVIQRRKLRRNRTVNKTLIQDL